MKFLKYCELGLQNCTDMFSTFDFHIQRGVGVFNCVVAIPATLLNATIILTILSARCVQTPSYLLLTSLAFSDLLVGFLSQPFFASILFTFGANLFFSTCRIFMAYYFTLSWASWASLFTITAISLDRYLAIKLKLRYKALITCFRVKCALGIIWLTSFFLMSLMLVFSGDIALYSSLGTAIHSLCVLVIVISYFFSYKALNAHCIAQVHPTNHLRSVNSIDVAKYRKLLKTMWMIVMSIFLTYLPLVIAFIIMIDTAGHYKYQDFKNSIINWKLQTLIFLITVMTLSSVLNPLICISRMNDLRNACGQTLRRLCLKRRCDGNDCDIRKLSKMSNAARLHKRVLEPISYSEPAIFQPAASRSEDEFARELAV